MHSLRSGLRNAFRVATVLAAVHAAPLASHAQNFPSRPITVIVPSGPGGMDTMVRLIGPELERTLGQPLIIDNKPGANGQIAMQSLRRADPDGHTLAFATISILAVNPFVIKDLRYNSLEDFELVARHVMIPLVWAAHPAKGFKSLQDVITFARANPGKVTMAFPGIGSFPHLVQVAFNRKNNINALLVPYRSAPEADMGAVSGVVDISVDNLSTMSNLVNDGKLTALAVTSSERSKFLPGVASWMEDSTGPFPAVAWYAFIAPKGTPASLVAKLNAAINDAIQSPLARERLDALGAHFEPLSPAQLHTFIANELETFGRIVKESGIEPQ